MDDTDMEHWQKIYPAINVEQELNSAGEWLFSNPKNRKSNYRRFLTNWFKRTQDRAPRQNKRTYSPMDETLQEIKDYKNGR